MANITSIVSPAEIYQAAKAPMKSGGEDVVQGADFKSMLSDAVKEADNLSTVADQGTQALLSGETDNIAQVMIDGTKAELSLNMVIQVRNKVLDAYNEVMRMSL